MASANAGEKSRGNAKVEASRCYASRATPSHSSVSPYRVRSADRRSATDRFGNDLSCLRNQPRHWPGCPGFCSGHFITVTLSKGARRRHRALNRFGDKGIGPACGEAGQAARRLFAGADGGLPTRRRLPTCLTNRFAAAPARRRRSKVYNQALWSRFSRIGGPRPAQLAPKLQFRVSSVTSSKNSSNSLILRPLGPIRSPRGGAVFGSRPLR